jgi:non-homologous end joining protein Ku
MALAKELIEKQSGPFEPEAMSNRSAKAVRELVKQNRSTSAGYCLEPATGKAPTVVNIMARQLGAD